MQGQTRTIYCTAAWTPEAVEILTRLWEDGGYSAAQIAKHIPGATRNAVIGKAARLNLVRGVSQQHGRDAALQKKFDAELRRYVTLAPPPPAPLLAASDEPKEPWQCGASGCNGTRQRPWDFCAPCLDKQRRANSRADQFDTVRSRSNKYTPVGRRSGAA